MRPGKKWKQFTLEVSKGVEDSTYLEIDSLEGWDFKYFHVLVLTKNVFRGCIFVMDVSVLIVQ